MGVPQATFMVQGDINQVIIDAATGHARLGPQVHNGCRQRCLVCGGGKASFNGTTLVSDLG